MRLTFYINIFLLFMFPVCWFAPLVRAGLLPLFGLSEISIISGLISLWTTDIALAFIVALFALIFSDGQDYRPDTYPHGQIPPPRWLPVLGWMGKLAMADVFLIALYITLIKGMGIGRIETAWGLYVFTTCILLSLWVSLWTGREFRERG